MSDCRRASRPVKTTRSHAHEHYDPGSQRRQFSRRGLRTPPGRRPAHRRPRRPPSRHPRRTPVTDRSTLDRLTGQATSSTGNASRSGVPAGTHGHLHSAGWLPCRRLAERLPRMRFSWYCLARGRRDRRKLVTADTAACTTWMPSDPDGWPPDGIATRSCWPSCLITLAQVAGDRCDQPSARPRASARQACCRPVASARRSSHSVRREWTPGQPRVAPTPDLSVRRLSPARLREALQGKSSCVVDM
jgi:hypothetical protein